MFSVGEGEAILVIFPAGRTWLIDGGSTNHLGPNERLGQLLVRYLEARGLLLEACVASHPHVDHAGALAPILTSGSPALAPTVTVYRGGVAWTGMGKWLDRYHKAIAGLDSAVEEVTLADAHREVVIADGIVAHLFAGSGAGPYTSLFMQLRFRSARLLFTGDAHCGYEVELLKTFGAADFRADMLKVTHHGSSNGTAGRVLRAAKPAFAIASTADEDGHRLEEDTLERLLGPEEKRRVFETLVEGDIIVGTDGEPYRGGVLYRVEFTSPGEFAEGLDAEVIPADRIQRERSDDPDCQ
ncbi:MAG: MBL fold metallo-hydrolase [Thermoleophilaceae bacterium]|nr:MBL fold metallo-hydrolase [Thermoleophilaceae bacterium]